MKIFTNKEYIIYCDHCGNNESIYNGDSEYHWDDTPSGYFHRQGWRTDEKGENICPECRKNYDGRCR